jgi:hypothetical protein
LDAQGMETVRIKMSRRCGAAHELKQNRGGLDGRRGIAKRSASARIGTQLGG